MLRPMRRREAVGHICRSLEVSQRRACRVLSQPRGTQRYQLHRIDQDQALVAAIRRLSGRHPRYGYRRITAMLRAEGWSVNRKRVYRLWRQEGLKVARRIKSPDVIATLAYLFAVRGAPQYLRSDNGPEFVSEAVRQWLGQSGVSTLYIAPGSPWENGYIESFNSRLSDELLKVESFGNLREAQVLVEQ